MGVPKSPSHDMVVGLYRSLFADLRLRHPDAHKDLERDELTLISRLDTEGLAFVTKTLPKLGKALDLALEEGFLSVPPEFKRSRGNRNIPCFLQGIFRKIFDASGHLAVDEPLHVRDLRQILFLAYKLELPYSDEQTTAVLNRFVATEEELRALQLPSAPFLAYARLAVCKILEGFDPKDIKPKHGPGAVATGEKLDRKWTFGRLYDNIHQCYPYYDYFIAGRGKELLDRKAWYLSLTRQKAGQAKVVLVPKDSRGPRLISCEPLEYQYIQQGLNGKLVSHLETHPLTRGHINFLDQSVNRELARDNSRYGYLCTLDLKDASDRVSCALVERLFPKKLLRYFMALRSTSTLLPTGEVVELTKYAPMGSALCFSVEALCFWALLVGVIVEKTQCSLQEAAREVYVYGDDLIAPSEHFLAIVEGLEACGLLVNKQKSFYRGEFRESCGLDAFRGVEVTPVRLSTVWTANCRDGGSLASYTAYANTFRSRGYEVTASHLFSQIRKVYGKLPYGLPTSGYPCEICTTYQEVVERNLAHNIPIRRHPSYQRLEVRVKTLTPVQVESELDGWPRLLRGILYSFQDADPSRLAVPRSAKIIVRWCRI